jgi:hypothetical protein
MSTPNHVIGQCSREDKLQKLKWRRGAAANSLFGFATFHFRSFFNLSQHSSVSSMNDTDSFWLEGLTDQSRKRTHFSTAILSIVGTGGVSRRINVIGHFRFTMNGMA